MQSSSSSSSSSSTVTISSSHRTRREQLKDSLNEARLKSDETIFTKTDLEKHLCICYELLGSDPQPVDEYLETIFARRQYRSTLLDFLAKEPKKQIGLKYRIALLWISSNHIEEIKKNNLWLVFDLLRQKNYLPKMAAPADSGSGEIQLCAWALQELKTQPSSPCSLANLAYATFLLGGVLMFPSARLTMDLTPSVKQLIKIGQRTGVCDSQGYFSTKQMPFGKFISTLFTHPEITKTPNFVKALSLIQSAILDILPKALKDIQDGISLKGFETELTQYYRHLATVFIPNLLSVLNVLRQQEFSKYLSVLIQVSKFILDFPVSHFLQVEEFIHQITRHCIANLQNLHLKEILEIVKLNNFVEIRYKKKFLTNSEKQMIVNLLVTKKKEFQAADFEMIMHTQFVLFEEFKNDFSAFENDFKAVVARKKSAFSKQQEHDCEAVFYEHISSLLKAEHKCLLTQNFICDDTGKEIDIAFILGRVKIAIHIDGQKFHYYLDRDEFNRTTLLRNQTLLNAGWINVSQPLSDKITDKTIETTKDDLIRKLRFLLPLSGRTPTEEASNALVLEAFMSAIHGDMTQAQLGLLLSLRLPELVDEPVRCGLKRRFTALKELLSPFLQDSDLGILIAQYDLPHPLQSDFTAFPAAQEKISGFVRELLVFPYTWLFCSKRIPNGMNQVLLCNRDGATQEKMNT